MNQVESRHSRCRPALQPRFLTLGYILAVNPMILADSGGSCKCDGAAQTLSLRGGCNMKLN